MKAISQSFCTLLNFMFSIYDTKSHYHTFKLSIYIEGTYTQNKTVYRALNEQLKFENLHCLTK